MNGGEGGAGADSSNGGGGKKPTKGGTANDGGTAPSEGGGDPGPGPGAGAGPGPGPGMGGSGPDSADLDGVDLSEVPADTAPSGCAGGFDPMTGTLTLELGGDASIVLVSISEGVITANGVACESEAGDPAAVDAVTSLVLGGGSGAETLYLDLSQGPYSGAFGGDGSISINLGGGADRVAILGSTGPDIFHAGSDADQVVFDLDADGRVDLSIAGEPALLVSTGGDDDVVTADGVALAIAPAAPPLAIYGGGAGDALIGGASADELFGGIGNDYFDAAATPSGADTFDGGDGEDTIDFSARTAALTITMGDGADDGEAGEKADVRDSVEVLFGGKGTNTITGGPASNQITGGPLVDVLDGGGGDDFIYAGAGDDTLVGGEGDDFLYGEEGDDDLSGGEGDDLLDGTPGKNSLDGGASDGDICINPPSDKASGCEL